MASLNFAHQDEGGAAALAGGGGGGGGGAPAEKRARTNIGAEMRAKLECPVCLQVPQRKIIQCVTGHKVCQDCFTAFPLPKICPTARCTYNCPPTRNRDLEELIASFDLDFTCKNQGQGCSVRLRRDPLAAHEAACVFRLVPCPDYTKKCADKVVLNQVAEHVRKQHVSSRWHDDGGNTLEALKVIRSYKDLAWNLEAQNYSGKLFFLHMICDSSGQYHFWMSINADLDEAKSWTYELRLFDPNQQSVAATFARMPVVPADALGNNISVWTKWRCPGLSEAFVKSCLGTKNGKPTLRICAKIDAEKETAATTSPNRPNDSWRSRLQNEYEEFLRTENVCGDLGITVNHASFRDVVKLFAVVKAPSDTPYEYGTFKIQMYLPPPKKVQKWICTYVTKIWHPNISLKTGYLAHSQFKQHCINEQSSLKIMLISVKDALKTPYNHESNNILNFAAAKQFKEKHTVFLSTARYWKFKFASSTQWLMGTEPYSKYDHLIDQLKNMGYNEEMAILSLSDADWDITKAIEGLLSQKS